MTTRDEADLADFLIVDDFVEPAREALDPKAFAYVSGGAGGELTIADNIAAFTRRRLRPRVLRGFPEVDLRTTMLGREVSFPVALAPTGFNRMAHDEGEVAVTRAAAAAGIVHCCSTFSTRTIEHVGEAADRPWFQLYASYERSVTESLVARAEAAGYQAVAVTVDLPVVGYRDRELRSHVEIPSEFFANMNPDLHGELADVVMHETDQGLSWEDIDRIRAATSMPVVLKGILTAEDARIAVEHGVDGIMVSNHGGRQLDRSIAALDALEEVVEAAGDSCEVYLDGGVRRGVDVVTALALGARAVFVGRPYLYALAVAGEAGVARCIEILREETANALHLMGAATANDLSRDQVIP
ncbi:MAG: alpha-hydroxy-acid oxidizing protein [Actinobacteria bacterium]|jgi:4-hydroxymandelate oxidase|nr:alpha-hydroxy-acid oxidizing protein [Actinomycetota bacterium]